ncbi:unnamed protein product [Prunus armeniaca]
MTSSSDIDLEFISGLSASQSPPPPPQIVQNYVCRSVNFTDQTVRAQENPANDPFTIGSMWKSSFWSILRYMIPNLLEDIMEVLVAYCMLR